MAAMQESKLPATFVYGRIGPVRAKLSVPPKDRIELYLEKIIADCVIEAKQKWPGWFVSASEWEKIP